MPLPGKRDDRGGRAAIGQGPTETRAQADDEGAPIFCASSFHQPPIKAGWDPCLTLS
ncbi:hypothetical protein QE379_002572 [Sphingomonas sp. SORGH_AS 879]|nr:hypothetical protein [Sphingomonas sp. SORGH_AS_0879]